MTDETALAIKKYVRNLAIGLNIMPTPLQIQTWVKINMREDVTLEEIVALKTPSKQEIQDVFVEELKIICGDEDATSPPQDVRDIRGPNSTDHS